MNSVFIDKNKTIRVIYSVENKLYIGESKSLSFIEKHRGYLISNSYRLGIELKENHGGRICYGYIGACVIPRNQKKIGIAFDYNTLVEKEIIEKSVYHSHTIDVGLPNEYRQAVEHYTISKLISVERFPWCDIVFNQFMYCSVGSSINIYTTIIRIMLSIINDNLQEKVVNYNEKNFIRKYIQEK